MIAALLQDLFGTNVNTGECANVADSTGAKMYLWHQRYPQSAEVKGIVYDVLSERQAYHKKGGESQTEYLVQLDIHHNKDTEARTVAAAVKGILSGWAGISDSTRWNYTTIENQVQSYNDKLRKPYIVQTWVFRKPN